MSTTVIDKNKLKDKLLGLPCDVCGIRSADVANGLCPKCFEDGPICACCEEITFESIELKDVDNRRLCRDCFEDEGSYDQKN